MAENTSSELDDFRNRWRQEVTARSKNAILNPQGDLSNLPPPEKIERSIPRLTGPPRSTNGIKEDEEEHPADSGSRTSHDVKDDGEIRHHWTDTEGSHPSKTQAQEPRSAIDYYEKAVEKEIQGNLGDSLNHYRKAFRLDEGVDKTYKNKHFPPPPPAAASKPANPNPSNAAVTVPNPAHHSLDGPQASAITYAQLIASFASLPIPGFPPLIPNSPPPASPISSIPTEILVEILYHLAISDITLFARLSQVCKRLAYLVATEDRIWRRVCLDLELGFPAMHYTYACSIEGTPLHLTAPELVESFSFINLDPSEPLSTSTILPLPSFPLSPTYPTYAHMFHHRPRLRFAGVYISTVNYPRPGASSPNQVSWTTPVHIVTYYRYLRFFRDGTAISLLTTSEPIDVVHYLTKEHLALHRPGQGHGHGHGHAQGQTGSGGGGSGGGGLPGSVMRNALKGRWKMSPPQHHSKTHTSVPAQQNSESTIVDIEANANAESEGNVEIETEGVDAKYFYSMQLALRSGSRNPRATKNNKLVWRGFWSYNRLTDDWAEFGLRNDRAFWWSRVKSFGTSG